MRALRAAVATLLLAAGLAARASVEEVPFVTTPDNVTMEMLRLADVGPRDTLIDLGSGDGRIVISAARHFGARGLGVEIAPNLVALSRENAKRAGVADRARFVEQDLFATDLAPATVITIYLLPEVNLQLRPALLALKPGTRVVSHDWDMGDWKPDRSIRVEAPEKRIGLERSSRLHLWIVPAPIGGTWCRAAPGSPAALRLEQNFQSVRGSLATQTGHAEVRGTIDGHLVPNLAAPGGSLSLELRGDRLHVAQARGGLAAYDGAQFSRAAGTNCR